MLKLELLKKKEKKHTRSPDYCAATAVFSFGKINVLKEAHIFAMAVPCLTNRILGMWEVGQMGNWRDDGDIHGGVSRL